MFTGTGMPARWCLKPCPFRQDRMRTEPQLRAIVSPSSNRISVNAVVALESRPASMQASRRLREGFSNALCRFPNPYAHRFSVVDFCPEHFQAFANKSRQGAVQPFADTIVPAT